jgi:hypothetical protein
MNKAIVLSNCTEGSDEEFNRWYDEIHAPEVIEKTPIVACQRFRRSDAQMLEGSKYRYLAIYEFEGDAAAVKEALGKSTFEMTDTLGEAEIVFFDAL